MPDKRPVNEPIPLPIPGLPDPSPYFGGRRGAEGEPVPMPFFGGPSNPKRDIGGEPIAMPFFGPSPPSNEQLPMPFFGRGGGKFNPAFPRKREVPASNPWLELFIRTVFGSR